MKNEFEYKGVIHIHSKTSDGSKPFSSLIDIARKSDLDFIILTDHNTLDAKKDTQEGWYDGVLALIGEEVSPPKNHYLALGIKNKVYPSKKNPQQMIDEVKKQGGVGFIAHMDWNLHPFFFLSSHSWVYRQVSGFDGVELWSYMHDWASNIKPWDFFKFCKNSHYAIKGPHPKTLRAWDQMTKERQVSAIGGIDAHARHLLPFNLLTVLPYDVLFNTIRTHIVLETALSEDWRLAASTLYGALSSGKCFISYDGLKDGSGFRCYIRNKNKDRVCFGEKIGYEKDSYLEVLVPEKADIKVVVSGLEILVQQDTSLSIPVDRKGVWRCEAHLDGKPWIFGNPIYVG